MSKTMKRVPLDFDYPIGKAWYGYLIEPRGCISRNIQDNEWCDKCIKFAKIMKIPFDCGCPDFSEYFNVRPKLEPPKGDGYQLWETLPAGSPVSPVFSTFDELCEWCEKNATTFSNNTATKEEWRDMISTDLIHDTLENTIIM